MIAELLAQLGITSEEIAESLRNAGITGRQRSICYCPIANWLKTKLDVSAIRVCVDKITVFIRAEDFVEKPPPAVQDFITDFDGDCYRDIRA